MEEIVLDLTAYSTPLATIGILSVRPECEMIRPSMSPVRFYWDLVCHLIKIEILSFKISLGPSMSPVLVSYTTIRIKLSTQQSTLLGLYNNTHYLIKDGYQ